VAARDRLQPREPVTAAGASEADRRFFVNLLVAAVGEDGRTTGKACAVLLADAGGRTPDESTVLGDVAQDRAVAASGKLND